MLVKGATGIKAGFWLLIHPIFSETPRCSLEIHTMHSVLYKVYKTFVYIPISKQLFFDIMNRDFVCRYSCMRTFRDIHKKNSIIRKVTLCYQNVTSFTEFYLAIACDVSDPGPSFSKLDWTSYLGTPLCQNYIINYDIVKECFNHFNWLPLWRLVPWYNHYLVYVSPCFENLVGL